MQSAAKEGVEEKFLANYNVVAMHVSCQKGHYSFSFNGVVMVISPYTKN
jgi:hypothetical protein